MTMTANAIVRALQVATHYDRRERTDADVTAWTEAASRADWTFTECVDAIHAHFAESRDYLMPAHVTERIRAERRERESAEIRADAERYRADMNAPRDTPPADPEHIRKTVNQLADQLGWNRGDVEPDQRRRALAVQCPHCHAVPGRPCARQVYSGPKRGQFVPMQPHPSRIDTADPDPDSRP